MNGDMSTLKQYRHLNVLLVKNIYSANGFRDFLGPHALVTQMEVMEQHDFEGVLYIKNSQ